MKNLFLKYYVIAVYFCSSIVLFAQPGDDIPGGGLEGGDPPAPIDDYVWVLAIVGLFFVFMKFRGLVQQKSLQK